MKSEIEKRNMVAVVLLYLLTFGIYAFYIYFVYGTELRNESLRVGTQTKLKTPFVAFLLALITFGIYAVYYNYKQAVALEEIGNKINYISFAPVLILICTLVLGIGNLLNIYSGSQIAEKTDTLIN